MGGPRPKFASPFCSERPWPSSDEDGKRTKARAVIDALVSEACEGRTAAIQQIFDRIDGILQPILDGPAIDLEAVARAMSAEV